MSGSNSEEDALVDDVYAYLIQKSYPKGCSSVRKRQITKRAERFSVNEGSLYHMHGGKMVQKISITRSFFRLYFLA